MWLLLLLSLLLLSLMLLLLLHMAGMLLPLLLLLLLLGAWTAATLCPVMPAAAWQVRLQLQCPHKPICCIG
jgi:hypothetical protein